jgi:hypothetical protein
MNILTRSLAIIALLPGIAWGANTFGGGGGGATTESSGVVHPNNATDDFSIGGDDANAAFFFDESTGVLTINQAGGGISVAADASLGGSMVLKEASGVGSHEFTLKVKDAGLDADVTCTIEEDGSLDGSCPLFTAGTRTGPYETVVGKFSPDLTTGANYIDGTAIVTAGSGGITFSTSAAHNAFTLTGDGVWYKVTGSMYITSSAALSCTITVGMDNNHAIGWLNMRGSMDFDGYWVPRQRADPTNFADVAEMVDKSSTGTVSFTSWVQADADGTTVGVYQDTVGNADGTGKCDEDDFDASKVTLTVQVERWSAMP